jgi:acyl-CoA synthetase (AMP-forming)/AMP-acid ligase II
VTIIDRINDWARRQPGKTALIHNDAPVSYAALARMVEARRRAFAAQSLPRGGTAVVIIPNTALAWTVVLGLRAVGLDTICVRSFANARELGVEQPACFVTAGEESEGAPDGALVLQVETNTQAQARVREVPTTALDGEIGGHILYTSGTTGTYKKVRYDPARELDRLDLIARARSNGPDTVNNAIDFGLWTTIGHDQPLSVWSVGGTVVIGSSTTR